MKRFTEFWRMIGEFLVSIECRIWLRLAVKPLAVLMILGGLLWVSAWCDTQIAQAEAQTTPLCPFGYDAHEWLADGIGLRCLPHCLPGYETIGAICSQLCPNGYTNDGAFCRKDAHIIAKQSYGRGAGGGLVCAANQEAQGGLCYPRCAPGYDGAGPVCWQRCKPGFADHGATCFKHLFDWYGKHTYGRGAGSAVSACAAGLEQSGIFCYPRCAPGYQGAGPVCYQQCPKEYKDDGALCRKDAHIFPRATYGRGFGELPNHPPFMPNGPIVAVPRDTPVPLPDLPATDEDGDQLIASFTRHPAHGAIVTLPGDPNTLYYAPNPGFEGTDSFDWQAYDGKHLSNTGTVTFIVVTQVVNVEPVAIDRTIALTEETPMTITVTCTDTNNDPLSYRLVDRPQHGEMQWLSTGQVVYTPTVDFVGTDRFTFRAYDGQAFSNISVVTLTVAAVNDAPVVVTQPISTTRNSNAAITLFATDAEGDAISYTLVSSPTHGALSGTAPDLFYTPARDFVGDDRFQFQAGDVHGAAAVATVNITVLPTNTAPLAAGLVLTTSQESAVAVTLTGSDADDDPLTYRLVSSPTHGTLTGAGPDWVYTPDGTFIGVESFTFTSSDGQAESAEANITIHVTAAPAAASLVGLVFDDSNQNGQPDANETGVSGLLVTLTPAQAQAAADFSTITDRIGAWRLDGVPFGQYTLRIHGASGIQLATPVEATITLDQRGVQQGEPVAIKVIGRALFLPLATR